MWWGAAVALIFAAGVLAGWRINRWFGSGQSRGYTPATLLRQVQTLAQLVTVQYVMEKVEILEDPPANLFRQFLPDNTRVMLIAHGVVKAGVDLSRLQPGDIQIQDGKAVIHLPRAQITDAYLDDSRTRVIERTTGFLRTFNKDLEQTTRQNALDTIRRAARSGGILKDAEERAHSQISRLLRQAGVREIEFKGVEPGGDPCPVSGQPCPDPAPFPG